MLKLLELTRCASPNQQIVFNFERFFWVRCDINIFKLTDSVQFINREVYGWTLHLYVTAGLLNITQVSGDWFNITQVTANWLHITQVTVDWLQITQVTADWLHNTQVTVDRLHITQVTAGW